MLPRAPIVDIDGRIIFKRILKKVFRSDWFDLGQRQLAVSREHGNQFSGSFAGNFLSS
jgi:hypothetical protein